MKKMYSLGWTGAGFFDHVGDEVVLLHFISRYHGFVFYIKIFDLI